MTKLKEIIGDLTTIRLMELEQVEFYQASPGFFDRAQSTIAQAISEYREDPMNVSKRKEIESAKGLLCDIAKIRARKMFNNAIMAMDVDDACAAMEDPESKLFTQFLEGMINYKKSITGD